MANPNIELPLAVAATVTVAGALAAGKHNPVDATSGALTMTLPTASTGNARARITVEKVDSSANAVTVSGSIRGTTTTMQLALAHETFEFRADDTGSWWPVAGHKTLSSLDGRYDAAGAAASATGTAVQKTNNLSDLANAGTARTNLGLGTAATQPSSAFLAAAAQAADSAKIAGIAVTGTPAVGQSLVASSASAATWAVPTITGQYIGSATTFAGLPTTDAAGQAASNGDWAFLTADVVGTGSSTAPQYPRGAYIYNGTTYTLGVTLGADFVIGTTAGTVAAGNDSRIVGAAATIFGGTVNAITANAPAVAGVRNTVNASSAPVTVTLPTPTAVGQYLIIERSDTSPVNAITVTGTIRGVANATATLPAVGVANEGALWVAESLTSWTPAASIKPKAWLDAVYAPLAAAPTGVAATDTATVNAAKTAGLRLQAGTYVVNKVTVNTGDVLRGSGAGKTVVQLANGVNDNTIETTNWATLTGTDTTSTPYDFEIADVTIDGNATNQTAGHGLAIYAYGYRLNNVVIRNTIGYGLWTEWGSASPYLGPNGMEALVANFKIHNTNGGGISHQGPHDTQFVNGLIVKNSGTASGTYAINIPQEGRANGSVFTAVHVYGGVFDYGLRNVSSGLDFVGCQFEGAQIAETIILGSRNKMSECKWFIGNVAANTVKGIVIGDATHTGINNIRITGKVEETGGGLLDLTYSGGDHHINLTGQFYSTTYPAAPVVGTIDSNSTVVFPIINSAGIATSDSIFQTPTAAVFKGQVKATTLQGTLDATNVLQYSLSANTALGTRLETLPRMFISGNGSLSNGYLNLSYFTPDYGMTISNLTFVKQGTAAVGATLVRFALFTVDGSNNLTCVARTASDTTLFTGSDGVNTRAIADNGAATPAAITSYALVRGQRYALGVLMVGATTLPQLSRTSLGSSSVAFLTPIMASTTTTTQTDIGASYASNLVSGSTSMFWGYGS